jgi:hypothetical protein
MGFVNVAFRMILNIPGYSKRNEGSKLELLVPDT